jgi:hypothetical protein
MPFCPVCKFQYVSGEKKCINCNCRLVKNLPKNEIRENINGSEVFLVSASDGIERAMIEGSLRTAHIPYFIKNKETGSYMRVLMGYSVFGVDFYVPSNLLLKAKEILDTNLQLQLEDTNTDEYAADDESELEHEVFEQPPEYENDEFLDNKNHDSMRFFGVMVFLSIIFSPVLLVILILWLLWLGFKNIIKFIINKSQ